jgi:hypothetical protein
MASGVGVRSIRVRHVDRPERTFAGDRRRRRSTLCLLSFKSADFVSRRGSLRSSGSVDRNALAGI